MSADIPGFSYRKIKAFISTILASTDKYVLPLLDGSCATVLHEARRTARGRHRRTMNGVNHLLQALEESHSIFRHNRQPLSRLEMSDMSSDIRARLSYHVSGVP